MQLENTGERAWDATPEFPLFITVQIRNLDGHIARASAGTAKLTQPIHPAQRQEIDIRVNFPKDFQPAKLCLDLVDGASNSASVNGLNSQAKILFPNPF